MPQRQPIVWTILLVVAAVWLWHPALFPVHVEGFSASIESIARHLLGGDLGNFDRAYPFDAEFFTLSRLGMNLTAALGTLLAGGNSGLALHAIIIGAFALLVISSAVLIRRWTQAPIGLVMLVLLLLPGLGESGFFYNDNVLSATLAMTALALVACYAGIGASLGAGLLFGAAILTRTDAALMAPALVLVLAQKHGFGTALGARLAIGGLVAAAVEIGGLAAFGLGPMDLLRITTYSVGLWQRSQNDVAQLMQAALFIGLPVGALMLGGLVKVLRQRNWLRIALLVGVPVLFIAVYWGKLWQARQFLLLTPFVAALAVEALVSLRGMMAKSMVQRIGWSAALLTILLLPSPIWFTDGPRSLTGRLWSPLVWDQWHGAVAANFAALDAAISGAPANTSVLITDGWDADRYLHLALQSTGFKIDAAALPSACPNAVEPFVRGEQTVLHVRLHLPFVPEGLAALPTLYQQNAAACLAALPSAPLRYVANAAELHDWLPDAPAIPMNGAQILPGLIAPAYLTLEVVEIDAAKLAALQTFYERVAAAQPSGNTVTKTDLTAISARLTAQTALLKAR